MELCRSSLRELLNQAAGRGLSFEKVARWFLQMSYALKAAHQSGATHHNLKPENVLFDFYGNAKLSDFGLARVVEVDASKGMPQVFVGTGGMSYMSPEQLSRGRESGPAADIYALGIILYEMLTGQLPGRRSPFPSEIDPQIPVAIDRLFDQMTHDKKEQRFQEMGAVIDAFMQSLPSQTLTKGELILVGDSI